MNTGVGSHSGISVSPHSRGGLLSPPFYRPAIKGLAQWRKRSARGLSGRGEGDLRAVRSQEREQLGVEWNVC